MVSEKNKKEHSILGLVINGLEYLIVLLKDRQRALEEICDENIEGQM